MKSKFLKNSYIKHICHILFSAFILSGCETGLFDSGPDEEEVAGTRISVLALERELRPSLNAVDTQIYLPVPEDTKEWSQAGGFSNHAMHHLTIGPSPRELWRVNAGPKSTDRNRNLGEPVIAEGKIFILDSKARALAYNAKNGKLIWRKGLVPREEKGANFLGGGLAYEKGRIFASTGFASVVALDARNGNELWRTQLQAPMRAAPTINGGRVVVVTVDNQVQAISAKDGKRLWTYSGVGNQTILLNSGSVAIDGGVVIAPFTNGEIAALRVDNGSVLWSDSVIAIRRTEAAASITDISGRPVIDRGRVYAVGHSGILVAIDLRTGQRIWDVPVPGVFQPWIAGDFLYATTIDSEIVCVDVRTGQILWVTQLRRFKDIKNQEKRIIWTGPSIVGDRLLIFGSNKVALSISPYTGSVLGELRLRAPVTIPPVFANSMMYVFDDNGDLTAYR
ncbi:MAG: PQQ-binding-like beta-propeller repeat protein [Pseudomonadota bacterium]|nr:PQQ-binding-like beta-propeller repeat protein [Pseudomonadota bacterium]